MRVINLGVGVNFYKIRIGNMGFYMGLVRLNEI